MVETSVDTRNIIKLLSSAHKLRHMKHFNNKYTLWMPRVPNGRGLLVLLSTSRTCPQYQTHINLTCRPPILVFINSLLYLKN